MKKGDFGLPSCNVALVGSKPDCETQMTGDDNICAARGAQRAAKTNPRNYRWQLDDLRQSAATKVNCDTDVVQKEIIVTVLWRRGCSPQP